MNGTHYKLFGEEYFESQGKMMARVFETLLRKHPQVVPEAIEKFSCLSATDYTMDLEALRAESTIFQNKTTCLIEGQTVCIGTSLGMPQKKSYISRLFQLCGEDERQFQILPKDSAPDIKQRSPAQAKKRSSQANGVGYTLFGKHMFSTQADMMCLVFESVFQKNPQLVGWAVSNLKCLSWTDYTSWRKEGKKPPYNFKNCRVITVGDRRLCVGTDYGIKAKSAFLDRLIRQSGLPTDVYQLDPPPSPLSWWQRGAVQAALRRLDSEDGKQLGIISMPAGTGKSTVIVELIRGIFQSQNPSWSILILTSYTALSYQYQERLKGLLGPSYVIERPKASELPTLAGNPQTVLCTTSQSLLNRSKTEYGSLSGNRAEPFSTADNLLVIMDEISVGFISKISRDIHDRFPNAAFLSFTAVPEPSPFLRKAFGPVIFQYTYDNAVQDGVLSPAYYESIQPDLLENDVFADSLSPQAYAFSEKRMERLASLLLEREKTFNRRVLVLCANRDEGAALYDLLAPALEDGRLRLRDTSPSSRGTMPPSFSFKPWDGHSFPGCVVLACGVTPVFPSFDVVYLSKTLRSPFDMACVLSLLTRLDGKRRESGRLVDLHTRSTFTRWASSASAVLLSQNVESSASLEAHAEQLEQALESRRFALVQDILSQLEEAFPNAGGAISEQLKFLEPPPGQSAALYWQQHAGSLAWYGDLWRMFRGELPQASDQEEREEDLPEPVEDEPYPAAAPSGTPQARGSQLEQVTKELLRQLFSIPDEGNQHCLDDLHVQGSGYQFGFDIAFTYRDAYGATVSCLVECKHYQGGNIKLNDIAGKLISANAQDRRIDHWLLISPHGKVSNELWLLQKQWQESGKWYPILDIQFWTADQEVGELFALFPQLYQQLYDTNPKNDPAGWSEERRRTALAKWREKLSPVPYLPRHWMNYLREPRCLLVEQEADLTTAHRYEALYDCCVPMGLLDQNELPVDGTAEEYFLGWLRREDSPCALLLGDFGDGKTFFTYTLARRLVKDFLASPDQGFIPLRISLQRLGDQPSACRDVLNARMREFSDGVREWNEVQGRYSFLIVLDGLDEMSQSMSDAAVLENLSILEEFIPQFKGHKLLVTSRKMVIYSDRIRRRLMTALNCPEVLHLAPVTPKDCMRFLQKMANTPSRQQRLTQIRQTHDLLGLAAKPLFLDMMRLQLDGGHVESMDSAGIYLHYAKEVLRRKQKQLALLGDTTHPGDIQERLLDLLEKLAVCLYRQGVESISLNDFKAQTGQSDLAERLWDCADMAQEEDTDRRVSNRSLLKYDSGDSSKRCFCHRSMKEYFIARGIVRQLLEQEAAGRALLSGPNLGYEILSFAGALLQAQGSTGKASAARRLTDFAHEPQTARGTNRLAVNSVNLLHYSGLGLPGQDWSGLCLDNALLSGEDLSGKNFSHSSMRYAHLDNADLSGCDLRHCDFTGVQFEKTGQLRAFTVLPGGDGLLAFYQDGTVRRWPFSDESAQTFAQPGSGKAHRVFTEQGGREAILDTERLQFLRRERNKVTGIGYTPLPPGVMPLEIGRQTALVRRQGALLLLRLADGECLGKLENSHAELACLLWETMVLLWSSQRGLELYDMAKAETLCQADVGSGSISALAAHAFSSGEGVAVLGSAEGEIISCRVIHHSAGDSYQIEHSGYAFTEGAAVTQAAADDGGLYIGLSSGKIISYRHAVPDGLIAGKVFHLEIKCSGARLDGVVPPEQRLALLHAQT